MRANIENIVETHGGLEINVAKEWENNTSKLHYIELRIEEWETAYNSCRQNKFKLNRKHIGYTRLTHGHLM